MDEIMNSTTPSQEVFQRVWQRVMGSAAMPGQASAPQPEPAAQPAPVSAPAPAPEAQSVMAPQRPGPHQPRPNPQPQPQPCCLRQQVLSSLEQWQMARLLARRAGSQTRQMTAIAAQLHQQAKQLSTAYFLQSGVRYWPVAQLTQPRMTTYVGGLRQLYQRCQALTQEFHTCRTKAPTQDLAQLYGQLEQAGTKRCAQMRALLEQTHL